MKPSPLRLEWISYPSLSFEARKSDGNAPISTTVRGRVIFYADGHHAAELHLDSAEADGSAYSFAVHVVATFGLELANALQAYKCSAAALPPMVAVNVIRVLYSGARELLATATARGPHGAAMIESVLIEPGDVEIGSVEPMAKILHDVFGVDDGTLSSAPATGKASKTRKRSPPDTSPATPKPTRNDGSRQKL